MIGRLPWLACELALLWLAWRTVDRGLDGPRGGRRIVIVCLLVLAAFAVALLTVPLDPGETT